MWRICTKEGQPVILIPIEDQIPEGYVEEGQTGNPSYLELFAGNLGRKITPLAFINRFTQAEQVAIDLASMDDPAATMQQRQLSATLRVYLRNINVASYVDLDREDTQTGVRNLETAGIIGVGRADAVLLAPVTLVEVPVIHGGAQDA